MTNPHDAVMDDAAFDRALIGAAFQMAAEQGWRSVSVAAAARAEAGGIAALIDSLAQADISDQERVEQGARLFDNLYALFKKPRR